MIDTQSMLIDGELVGAEGGREYDNINPATEEVIGQAPAASREDAERAVRAARRAFDETNWSTDYALRRTALLEWEARLRASVDEIRSALVAESGMPVSMAMGLGVDPALNLFGAYIERYEQLDLERAQPPKEIFGTPVQISVRWEPIGVVSCITPWNVPFEISIRKVAAALVTGNTVVLKTAPETPWAGTILAAAAAGAGFPPGVLNIITTPDNTVAEVLTRHPDVDAVHFTGSTATGRAILAAAAPTVKRVSLELGGKSAAIVLDDADFATAVATTTGSVCVLSGQGCTHTTRLLVPRARLEEAGAIAAATMEAIPYGDPLDPTHMMGPQISARQLERVLDYMEIGKKEARLLTGGGRATQFAKGYFTQPTVFTDVPVDARVAQEEIFGPVICLLPFEDDDDAVRIANSSIFGLSGAVWSADLERADRVANRLRTGTVSLNGAQWFDVDTPFGGYKQSGLGREFGSEGLHEFLEIKAVARPA